MYKFIQRKKKLLLALFGVILMIAFIVPAGINQMAVDPDSIVVGEIGEEKLTQGDVQQAYRDLEALSYAQFSPLDHLGSTLFGPNQVAAQLREHPETYALLQREAKAAGVAVDEETVSTLFTIYFRQRATTPEQVAGYRAAIERFLLVRNSFQRVLADVKITHPVVRDSIAGSQQPTLNVVEFKAAEFLPETPAPTDQKIISHYNQYAAVAPAAPSAFGATQPVQFGYRQPDKLKLQYLELPADQLVDAVIANFKPIELLPLQSVAYAYYIANPSEFQTPATLPATAPTTSTTAPATAPDMGPTTASATQPATGPAAGPTTRPFAEVRPDIQRKLLMGQLKSETAPPEDIVATQALRQRVEDRAAELRTELRDRLVKDYRAASGYDKIGPVTRPAVVSLGAHEKLEYLEGVASDFEKAHGLRPTIRSLASDWLTAKDLAALPGIGGASADGVPFPMFATRHAEELTPDNKATTKPAAATGPANTQPANAQPADTQPAATQPADTQPADTQPAATQPTTEPATQPADATTVKSTKPADPALVPYEPSPLLTDAGGNAYIFRLTTFNGEHVPTLDEAREQIVKDLKLAQAYDLARKKAVITRDGAASAAFPAGNSKIGGLPIVSPPVIEVGPISLNNQQPEIPGYDVSDPAVQQRFLFAIAGLLRNAKASEPHPATLIELPAQQKMLVVELRSLERPWTAEDDAEMQMNAIANARTTLMSDPVIQEALQSWFDREAVSKRMNYKEVK